MSRQVNSALHPSGVAKSSTSFRWDGGWEVTLCDPISWHVISRRGEVISTNFYRFIFKVFFTLHYLYEVFRQSSTYSCGQIQFEERYDVICHRRALSITSWSVDMHARLQLIYVHALNFDRLRFDIWVRVRLFITSD